MTYNEKLTYLRSYRQQEYRLDALLSEAERWKSRAKAMTGHYTTPPGKGPSVGFVGAVEKVLELEAEISREIDAIQATRSTIQNAIGQLEDPRQANVLRLKYLAGKREQNIAQLTHYHLRYVQKLARQGVKNIEL